MIDIDGSNLITSRKDEGIILNQSRHELVTRIILILIKIIYTINKEFYLDKYVVYVKGYNEYIIPSRIIPKTTDVNYIHVLSL